MDKFPCVFQEEAELVETFHKIIGIRAKVVFISSFSTMGWER